MKKRKPQPAPARPASNRQKLADVGDFVVELGEGKEVRLDSFEVYLELKELGKQAHKDADYLKKAIEYFEGLGLPRLNHYQANELILGIRDHVDSLKNWDSGESNPNSPASTASTASSSPAPASSS